MVGNLDSSAGPGLDRRVKSEGGSRVQQLPLKGLCLIWAAPTVGWASSAVTSSRPCQARGWARTCRVDGRRAGRMAAEQLPQRSGGADCPCRSVSCRRIPCLPALGPRGPPLLLQTWPRSWSLPVTPAHSGHRQAARATLVACSPNNRLSQRAEPQAGLRLPLLPLPGPGLLCLSPGRLAEPQPS